MGMICKKMAKQAPATPPALPNIAGRSDHIDDCLDDALYVKRNGKWWFEGNEILDEKMAVNGALWHQFISASMADFYTKVKNSGQAPENHAEFLNYIAAAAMYLTGYELSSGARDPSGAAQ